MIAANTPVDPSDPLTTVPPASSDIVWGNGIPVLWQSTDTVILNLFGLTSTVNSPTLITSPTDSPSPATTSSSAPPPSSSGSPAPPGGGESHLSVSDICGIVIGIVGPVIAIMAFDRRMV